MILFQKNTKKERAKDAQTTHGLMSEMCRNGLLEGLIDDYIGFCHSTHTAASEDAGRSKAKVRTLFPNLAGFCRYLNTGLSDLGALAKDFPEEYERVLAIFEDEALNSEVSPTLLSAYLKKRLRYVAPTDEISTGSKEVRYCFEHDIFADGE